MITNRYVADQTENGDSMVLDLAANPAHVVCGCRSDVEAEMIADALMHPEFYIRAVEALREIARPIEVDVNGEYTTTKPIDGHDARNIARRVLADKPGEK